MKVRFPPWFFFIACVAAGCLLANCAARKEAAPRIVLAEGVKIPAVTGLAWLGAEIPAGQEDAAASPGEGFSGGECFASLSDDGVVRVWEVFSGRLIEAFPVEAGKPLSRAPHGESAAPEFWPETVNWTAAPVFSPGKTKRLSLSPDGAVCLEEASGGKLLARYYGFAFREGMSAEWLSVVPEGFYNASFLAASCFTAEQNQGGTYRLDQLSGALFRPDLFRAHALRDSRSGPPLNAGSLLGKAGYPPEVNLAIGERGELEIKISAQNGGAGWLAVYRRPAPVPAGQGNAGFSPGEEIPAGLLDVEQAAEKKYSEKGGTCYELTLRPEGGEFGISAFNESNTIESARIWITVPGGERDAAPAEKELPALKALLAASEDGFERHAASLEKIFSAQAEGTGLYSAVEVKTLSGADFTRAGFAGSSAALFAGGNKNDVHLLYVRGRGYADSFGNLRVKAFESEISAEDILAPLLAPLLNGSSNSLVLMDLLPDSPEDISPHGAPEALETALVRFRQRLGPKAMLGGVADPRANSVTARTIAEKLYPDLLSGPDNSNVLNTPILELFGNRYVTAVELLDHAAGVIAERGSQVLVFFPGKDFTIADRFINAGELKFQTMASGMLKIDRVDKEPIPLVFGTTMSRTLPPGGYIIDMIYRNGYRETRTVELRKKASAWVIFSYTPPLLVGDFSLALKRSGGINISELNPANYQKVNREAMESMGMAPYYVAFLAGEKLYKEENYDRAIGEYSRAISLKADYAEAYVSRGNAQRRKGDFNRAIDDYTAALRFKSGYAEVYNYRGFAYAQQGDLLRAITDYTQAIRYKADYADAYFNRAHAYGKQGDWDLSIADYTQIIRLEPSNGIAYRERGNAWRGKGEMSRADADYQNAEQLDNTLP